MSRFDDNPNVTYELHTFDGDDDITNIEMNINITSTRFRWMNKLIMYICCVPRSPSTGKPISKSCRFVATLCNISAALVLLASLCITYYQLIFSRSIQENGNIFTITSLAFIFGIILLRLSVLYYFHFHFNYPWNLRSTEIEKYQSYNHSKGNSKFYIFVITTCILLQLGFFSVFLNPSIAGFANIFFILIPNFVLLIIQSVVSFKYQRFLLQLINNMDNVDLGGILKEYKELYHEFKIDYPRILQFGAHLQIIPVVALCWAVSYDYVYGPDFEWDEIMWVILYALSIIILYVSSGCYVSETLELFQKYLWKKAEENVDKNNLSVIESMLIIYTMNHSIHITFAGVRVTKKNTIMFVVGFIASRFVAKLATMLY